MQTVIQVFSSSRRSLRDLVVKDVRLTKFQLSVSKEKTPGRSHGWAKLHSTDEKGYGAINIEWHQSTKMLICRVITRGTGRPNLITGDFIDYLLARHRTRILSITILPK